MKKLLVLLFVGSMFAFVTLRTAESTSHSEYSISKTPNRTAVPEIRINPDSLNQSLQMTSSIVGP